VIFFVILGGMLVGRWSEFRYSHPLTATGEPATAAHLHRYLWGAGGLCLGIWVAANLIGNQFVGRLG
jgi:hypothetical protein